MNGHNLHFFKYINSMQRTFKPHLQCPEFIHIWFKRTVWVCGVCLDQLWIQGSEDEAHHWKAFAFNSHVKNVEVATKHSKTWCWNSTTKSFFPPSLLLVFPHYNRAGGQNKLLLITSAVFSKYPMCRLFLLEKNIKMEVNRKFSPVNF